MPHLPIQHILRMVANCGFRENDSHVKFYRQAAKNAKKNELGGLKRNLYPRSVYP